MKGGGLAIATQMSLFDKSFKYPSSKLIYKYTISLAGFWEEEPDGK